jgi:hypothetical protein
MGSLARRQTIKTIKKIDRSGVTTQFEETE